MLTDQDIKKYFKIAKTIAEGDISCLSRGIGSVIVDPKTNCIVSTGQNGRLKGLLACDSYYHLKEYVYPQLTTTDKKYLSEKKKEDVDANWLTNGSNFGVMFEGCGQCPRRLVGAKSGERLELCSCKHSETNAINNAAAAGHSTYNCTIICWCYSPCNECTSAIIDSQLSTVYCLEEEKDPANAYGFWRSEWMFRNAGVKLIKVSREWVLANEN